MATNPATIQQQEADRRRHEAEAAAILLLARKRYDIPAMIAAQGIRPRPFRRISPTAMMATDLAQPYMHLVRAWQAEQPGLVTAYRQATASRMPAIVHRQIEQASARVEQHLAVVRRQMRPTIQRIEQWHRAQWLAKVKASTGLDVAVFTGAAEVAPEVDNAAAWNERLADDVHAQAKGRISSAMIGALAVAAPASRVEAKARQKAARAPDAPASVEELIADAVMKARTRAKAIAVDQVEKASAGFTRARRQSAGIGLWRWRHLDRQPHPRIEHIRRNGIVYSDTRPPPTQPSEEPFCKCWAEPIFE